MKGLPNLLTFLRIAVIPVLIVLLLTPDKVKNFAAGLIYSAASLTDLLDGYLARKYGSMTKTGKLFDPLADKLLVSTAFIMLVALERVEAWIVALIIGRELAVTGLRGMASSEGLVIQASRSGKYKASFQLVAAACLIMHGDYLTVNFHRTGMIFLWIALLLTLWSGVDYFWKYLSAQMKEGR